MYIYVYIYIFSPHPPHTGLAHLVSEIPKESAAAADTRVFDLQLSLYPAAQVRP
jgi:hypothetical protein